jgi:hypothetical protein
VLEGSRSQGVKDSSVNNIHSTTGILESSDSSTSITETLIPLSASDMILR